MYSYLQFSHLGMTYLFAYRADWGIDTLEDLYKWESRDVNNSLFPCDSPDHAEQVKNETFNIVTRG